jgi:hypothetical protein
MAAKFEVYRDIIGRYAWRLKAANGDTIARSETGYPSRNLAHAAIESIKAIAPDAEIEEGPSALRERLRKLHETALERQDKLEKLFWEGRRKGKIKRVGKTT